MVVLCLLAAFHTSAQYSEQDLIDEANTLFEKGAFAEAMPLYSQLLSLNPTNPVFNYKYGATALYGDAEKKEEAVKYLKFSVGKPQVDDQSWYYLGRAYHLNYLFQDAVSAYQKYQTLASKSDQQEKELDLKISMARSGQNLLSQIKEIKVLDKKQSPKDSFFRIYDLSHIGGKILVTPEELLTSEDKKRNHRSLIHFRGSGTTIYFSSYGKSGKTGLDIYRADVLPDGSFSTPALLQGAVNTPYDEDFPYLHPDDKTFYFSSKGHGSMGGYDVYKSGYTNGVFSKPVNLDFAVNTPDDDLFYLADSLNEMAYFASTRSSKQGQLDVYKVLVKSAPIDITLIKGTFINQIDPVKKLAKITTIDATTNKEVDVQYTDPATGEYVLSFPRGGKYKFLVEEKSSDKIHAGLVDVPVSAGVKAYLQEMELISSSGVEKLLINNLFDQTYEGDVMALAQKMLRQRAALDVNFDPDDAPVTPTDPVAEKDPELAYSDAGFGAGMSNEKILEQAEARVAELKDRKVLAAQLAESAAKSSGDFFAAAKEKGAAASTLATATTAADGEPHRESMYKAGLAKLQAESALRKAGNAKTLKEELNQKATLAQAEYDAERDRVDALSEAIDSGDYDSIYAGLAQELEKREGIDPVADRFDPVQDIRRKGLKSDEEARKLLDRAQNLRDQEEQLNASLITKRTQRSKMKGKELKQIEEEIAVLESDIAGAQRKTERAFKQAEDAQLLADDQIQQFEILTGIAGADGIEMSPTDAAPAIAWTETEQKLLAENLDNLEIDPEVVAQYTAAHPEVFEEMGSEALAMNFRRTYALGSTAGEEVAANLSSTKDGEEIMASPEEINSPAQEPLTKSDAPAESDLAYAENVTETEASESNLTDPSAPQTKVDEKNLEKSEPNDTAAPQDQKTLSPSEGNNLAGNGEANQAPDDAEPTAYLAKAETTPNSENEQSENQRLENHSIEYDESMPVENRIEVEQLKIQAAEDWVAIIDESIAQLESGVGGEEDAEEQLANYRKLREKKRNEIQERQALIADWSNDVTDAPSAIAISTAQADLDTLSTALISRLESKIPTYSTKIGSIRSVSSIDRDYLPLLTEIEISGLSDPEKAEKRMELNRGFITDIDQIISSGIDTEVSAENLLEMRRVKTLELMQDEEIMEGSADYAPRTVEAQEYAALISDEEEAEKSEPTETYTELSPSLVESLESDFSKEVILPDYASMIEEAELTTNPEVAAAQRYKVKSDYLNKLQSEISFYKTAIDAAENPDPKLVERYGTLLRERSEMIDEVNSDRELMEGGAEAVVASAKIDLSADSLITALRNDLPLGPNETGEPRNDVDFENANSLISEQIDEYVAVLDDPSSVVNRDAVQGEIQKLQAFQEELTVLQTDQIAALPAALGNASEEAAAQLPLDASSPQAESIIETQTDATNSTAVDRAELAQPEASPEDQGTAADRPKSGEVYSEEVEQIQRISENLLADFNQRAINLAEMPSTKEADPTALAALNAESVDMIESSIDSLVAVRAAGTSVFQQAVDAEINELMALSADRQQEADRLLAEAEMNALAPAPKAEPELAAKSESGDGSADLAQITVPEISNIQYKSLNASIIRSGLKVKADSINQLKSEYANLATEAERAAALERMKRIEAEMLEGMAESNLAEIAFYQSENERILSELSAERRSSDREIGAIETKLATANAKIAQPELAQNTEEQTQLLAELAEVNADLNELEQTTPELAEEETTDRESTDQVSVSLPPSGSTQLTASSVALLDPESHNRPINSAYLTKMQAETAQGISENRRAELAAEDEYLIQNLTVFTTTEVEDKKELIGANTKVDQAGVDLLAENPAQLNYLVAMIRADSLKTLEQKSASYAMVTQNQAIERITEADRLFKMLPNQETERDRKNVRERAQKLEQEAEVLYEKSVLAAEQAELIRAQRSANDGDLIARSGDLSLRKRRALDELLLKPGYRIISSEEPVAVAVNQKTKAVETPKLAPKPVEAMEPVAKDLDTIMDLGQVAEEMAEPMAETKREAETVKPEIEVTEPKAVRPEPVSESTPLAEIKGNWLSMVEIIAEKDDFSDVEESMFVEASANVYSAEKPIPIEAVMPDGLIFQVQVGAYRNPIPQDLFGAYAPIMGTKLANGITRYRAGLFRKYEEATQAKNEIRANGYSDAFVVVYVNGEKLTGTEARNILAKAKEEERVSVELVSGVPSDQPLATNETEGSETPKANAEYYNDPEAAEAAQVEVITGLFFTVQVGVYSKPVKLDQLYNLTELNSELTSSGVIRYTTGRFGDLNSATGRKEMAREKGVTDAFITAYYNGKRISLAEARKVLDEEGTGVLADQVTDIKPAEKVQGEGESYVVIMGTFVDDVPQELANLFLQNKSWGIRKIKGPGNGAIYLSEDIKSLEDARKLLDECKRLNIKSASIGTMKDGQITSVQID